MFQMTVVDALKLHDNLISVTGPCINRNEFTNRLADDAGEVYEAHIPFDKTLIYDESRVILGITGKHDVESLKGRTLKSVN
ncbi:MAG: hypothetical protein FWD25_11445 [Clostridia bacterium]|nr:hypothetical protein [Clostridia bacterium]